MHPAVSFQREWQKSSLGKNLLAIYGKWSLSATVQALKSHYSALNPGGEKNDNILVLGKVCQTSTLDHLRWSFMGFVSGWMPDTTSDSLTYVQ